MDFTLSPEQRTFQDSVRNFAVKELQSKALERACTIICEAAAAAADPLPGSALPQLINQSKVAHDMPNVSS